MLTKRTVALAAGIAVLITSAVSTTAASAAPAATTRVYGGDRYSTAVSISRTAFQNPDDAHGVVIASGAAFPDALAGGPLAAKVGGPVLLSDGRKLTSDVKNELTRLGTLDQIYIVGGTGAITKSVERQLAKYAPVKRLGGGDRYETSQAVAREICATGCSSAFIADGRNHPDALSASGPAALNQAPVLLVPGSKSNQAGARSTLAKLGVSNVWVIGGKAVVSPSAVSALGVTARRLGGADRYDTNRLVNARFPGNGKPVYLASGSNYPDALAAAGAIGRTGGSLVLTAPKTLLPATRSALMKMKGAPAVVVGGPSVVSPAVLRAADQLLHPAPLPEPPLKSIDPSAYVGQKLVRKAATPGAFQLSEDDVDKALPTESLSLTSLKALPAEVTAAVAWTRDGAPIDAPSGNVLTFSAADVGHRFQMSVTLSGKGYEKAASSLEEITVVADPTISESDFQGAVRSKFVQLLNAERVRVGTGQLGVLTSSSYIQTREDSWVQYLAANGLPAAHDDREGRKNYPEVWPSTDSGLVGNVGNIAKVGGSSGRMTFEYADQVAAAVYNVWATSPQHYSIMTRNMGSNNAYWVSTAVDWRSGAAYVSFAWG